MAKQKSHSQQSGAEQAGSPAVEAGGELELSLKAIPPQWIAGGVMLLAIFLWSYWPTLAELVKVWQKEQDYSHGFLVLPIALFALWLRRDALPVGLIRFSWLGLILIGASVAMRYVGGLWYFTTIEGWSMLLWLGGVCWLLGGWHFFKWTLPGVAFLWFMIPLPHAVETSMRLPLQKIATKMSSIFLQSLGQPALAEGTEIVLGDQRLNVEEACSGLRIFVTIVVLAVAYCLIIRPAWWEKLVLLAVVVPIALLTNALRIVITGLLYQFASGKVAQKFSHDLAGWLMIPLAAVMFGMVLWYLGNLFREVEVVSRREALRGRHA